MCSLATKHFQLNYAYTLLPHYQVQYISFKCNTYYALATYKSHNTNQAKTEHLPIPSSSSKTVRWMKIRRPAYQEGDLKKGEHPAEASGSNCVTAC